MKNHTKSQKVLFLALSLAALSYFKTQSIHAETIDCHTSRIPAFIREQLVTNPILLSDSLQRITDRDTPLLLTPDEQCWPESSEFTVSMQRLSPTYDALSNHIYDKKAPFIFLDTSSLQVGTVIQVQKQVVTTEDFEHRLSVVFYLEESGQSFELILTGKINDSENSSSMSDTGIPDILIGNNLHLPHPPEWRPVTIHLANLIIPREGAKQHQIRKREINNDTMTDAEDNVHPYYHLAPTMVAAAFFVLIGSGEVAWAYSEYCRLKESNDKEFIYFLRAGSYVLSLTTTLFQDLLYLPSYFLYKYIREQLAARDNYNIEETPVKIPSIETPATTKL